MFRRALEAAVAADRGAEADGGGTVPADGTVADGGAVAEGGAASAAGAAGTEPADAVDEAVGVERSLGQRQADALGRLAECALAGGLDRGTAGDRYQVVLHVDAEALVEDPPPSTAELAGGDGDGLDAGGTDGIGDVPRERRGRCAGREAAPDRTPGGRRRLPRTAAFASGRRRPAASPATPPPSPCGPDPTAACSTSAAAPGPSPPRCAEHLPRATGSAASPAARPGAATRTISITGPTAGRPRSPTSSCCAGHQRRLLSYL